MEAQKVLVAVNGGQFDEEAVRLACSLVRGGQGVVYALYVIEVQRTEPVDAEEPEEAQRGEEVLQRIEELARELKRPIEADVRQARNAGPTVVQEAVDRKVDLIILAMPYKRHFGTFSMGETVPFVLKHAPCSVLLWRAPAQERVKSGLAR